MSEPKGYAHIYAVVKRIPVGRVATYGQIAELAGIQGHARQVGYALNALSEDHEVPWHRVINALGRIRRRTDSEYDDLFQQFNIRGIGFQGCILKQMYKPFDSRQICALLLCHTT